MITIQVHIGRSKRVKLKLYQQLQKECDERAVVIESLYDTIEKFKDDIDELERNIANSELDFELDIRDWHDREHDEGWATCGHEVCRIAIDY